MKIAVVGSREFREKDLIGYILSLETESFHSQEVTIVSGGARGVDSWAEEIADLANFKKEIFKPEWDKYGKSAGFIRNKLIVNEADKVIAFWDGQSKGTKHSIDLAIKASKPIDIYIRN